MGGHDIIIVDDESDIRELVSGILSDEGYVTRVAANGVEAIEALKTRQPHLVILDVWLGNSERDGLRILDVIQKSYPSIPVVMISGHSTIETAVAAIKMGAYDFIEKPFQTDRLLIIAKRAIESARLKRENSELKIKARVSSPLVGPSSTMNHLRQLVEKIAIGGGRFFVSSPFGFDREALVRDIHGQSKRKEGPFISINCASLSPSYVEAELFGVEYGGEAGQEVRKTGAFEKAHTGTLFLDDITALPVTTQSKIVKILHENTFCRVGSQQKIDIDVRFSGGSSRPVGDLIAKGLFREDLFYRLSLTHFDIPPLHERKVDIDAIVEHYMQDAASAHNLTPRRFSEAAIAMLQSYPWPGDVEQLRNLVDRLILMASGDPRDPISPEHLPVEILTGNSFVTQWQRKSADIVVLPLREAREAFEREYLLTQVNRFSGNISQTARFIGMERSALHRKLRSLGIQGVREWVREDEPETFEVVS